MLKPSSGITAVKKNLVVQISTLRDLTDLSLIRGEAHNGQSMVSSTAMKYHPGTFPSIADHLPMVNANVDPSGMAVPPGGGRHRARAAAACGTGVHRL